MKLDKIKGVICGIVAAITYGTNPLGALNLYAEGINTSSVLFYRYGISVLILVAMMLIQRESFSITKKELKIVAPLGVLFAISSISLFMSFNHMDAGIASTILFVYPVMVAIIMAMFFKEKITVITAFSILLSILGIGMLYQDNTGTSLSLVGVSLVIISSLAYAIYIVVVNKSSINFSPVKLTFYVMIFGTVTILIHSLSNESNHLQMLSSPAMWGWAAMLAVFPTVISLLLMVVAVKKIGSTPTAIMGALEPVTAVIIGVAIFNEAFTTRLAWGILMILCAVTLIIIGKPLAYRIYQTIGYIRRSMKAHRQ